MPKLMSLDNWPKWPWKSGRGLDVRQKLENSITEQQSTFCGCRSGKRSFWPGKTRADSKEEVACGMRRLWEWECGFQARKSRNKIKGSQWHGGRGVEWSGLRVGSGSAGRWRGKWELRLVGGAWGKWASWKFWRSPSSSRGSLGDAPGYRLMQ